MSVHSRLAAVKRVPAGSGVSYGHTYVTERETTLGLVPLGYADGVPRHVSNRAEVSVGGGRHRIAGRVCMDQFVVDLGDVDARPGDPVELFGPGDADGPTAQDWADAAGTISYEIVTGVRGRAIRRWIGAEG
jgi:alanine racemase